MNQHVATEPAAWRFVAQVAFRKDLPPGSIGLGTRVVLKDGKGADDSRIL